MKIKACIHYRDTDQLMCDLTNAADVASLEEILQFSCGVFSRCTAIHMCVKMVSSKMLKILLELGVCDDL